MTLAGPPGIGKTRLARQVMQDVRGRYARTSFAELAGVDDAAALPRALASELGIAQRGGESALDALVAHLGRGRLLLVLDNCEHLVPACAELVTGLGSACPALSVLTTSRQPIGVPGEVVFFVASLPVPPAGAPPEALAGFEAVRLFVERASLRGPFTLDAHSAPAVGEICVRLDGIPLAIELAAARVGVLTPHEIARRLEDRLGLLVDMDDRAPARHRTMQAAIDWSHDLLGGPERAVLRRLAVFTGGFGLEAARGVCSGPEVEPERVAALLDALVAKSLLTPDEDAAGGARYTLLEVLREYAGERLAEAGESAGARTRHAHWYLSLAERAEPELAGPAQDEWLERLSRERENVRSAVMWLLATGEYDAALRLTGALVLFWRGRCLFEEGSELLGSALTASAAPSTRSAAKTLWGSGFLTLMAGDREGAVPKLEESLSRFRGLGDSAGSARALLLLGNCAHGPGERALARLEESITLARGADDHWCLAHALGVAGAEHRRGGRLSVARRMLEEGLAIARAGGNAQGLRYGLIELGLVAVLRGDYRPAEQSLKEALAITERLGEDYDSAIALQHLGRLAIGRGDHGRARELLESAIRRIGEVAPPGALIDPLGLLAETALAAGDHTRAGRLWEEALAQARNLNAMLVPALRGLGELAAERGDTATARSRLEAALEHARRAGDRRNEAYALDGLGRVARLEGGDAPTRAMHEQALALHLESENAPGAVSSAEALAGEAAAGGRHEQAARLFGAAMGERERNGWARTEWRSRHEPDLALTRGGLSGERFEAALARGRRLSLEQALAAVPASRDGEGGRDADWSSLTRRERELARLVAEGMTNPQIAQRLVISRGTVKVHVSNILRKLGLASRTELAREVWRHEPDLG